jgi:tetratricopeptide (TPR) repeat protein
MRFPGFKKMSGYNPVELSNEAYGVGSVFFWRGHFDKARNLLKIAADLDTGSAASISSKTRLDILDGKFEDAMKGSLQRASRYGDAYAYRDYMGWLFAFGRGEEAWAVFAQLHDKVQNPQVWLAADLGLRIESRPWSSVRSWLMSDGIRASGRIDSFAQSESVMFNAMDRVPAPDFAEATRAIEDPPRTEVTQPPVLFVLAKESGSGRSIGVPPSDITRRMPPVLKHGERVPSHQAFFADAYAELRRGNLDASSEKFLELARRYPIEGHPGWMFASYTLPYFAWATAHSGDKYKIEAYLDANEPVNDQRFDFYLAKAFFTGVRGDHKTALDFLKKAFDSRPYTENRPIFTEYQWGEACDWLYDASGDEQYRKLALEWARANQRTSPFFSWPYSMEAKLTTVANDRRRALGFALYLDPGSERIAKFSDAEKEAARQWFKANNPFLPDAHAERKTALR